MISNIRKPLINIYDISRLLQVKNKKLKILYSVTLSNAVVILDLIIIYLITSLFQVVYIPEFIRFINLNSLNKFLPLFIILRYLVVYLDTMNIHKLRLDIEENLRTSFLDEVFLRGNFSISDSYFYINTLCVHISTFYQNFTILITSFVKFSLFTLFIIFNDKDIIVFFLVGLILLMIPSRYFTKLNRKYSHISYESSLNISQNVERVIDNLYLIKILNKFFEEKKSFEKSLRNYYESQLKNQKYGTLNSIFPSFTTMLLLAFLMIYFPIGSMITLELIAIILRLFQSLGEFNRVFSMSISTYVHLEKFLSLEKNKESVFSQNFNIESLSDEYLITLENVDFKYLNSNKYVFKNLSLKIKKGEHTIITGPNGVGKSTFLGLISGVFYAESGLVNLGTKKISYVSAYPMIIRGTLRENAIYGVNEEILDSEIISKINSFNIFENKDYDLNQEVSNKTLSSGQMQKLSFVRALLSNPDLLLLDESTSNLDVSSKLLINRILSGLEITIINSTHSSEELENYDNELKFFSTENETQINEI